jgi:hypothetical protein
VLSPQYLLWLLPLVPLSAGGLAGLGLAVLFVAACWTTSAIFPANYGPLLNLQPAAVDLLLFRNALLALLWAALLLVPLAVTGGRRGEDKG